jgi:hypothetical protein
MRRSLFLTVAVGVAAAWCQPASAQFFGGPAHDVNAEIEAARNQQRQQVQKYSPRSKEARARAAIGAGGDTYGRVDMSGRPVPGYPTIRGNITGSGASRVSRGGANGAVKSRRRR